MTQREYWYWFSNIHGIGIKKMRYLIKHFGTPEQIYKCSQKMLSKVEKISDKNIEAIMQSKDENYIKKRLEILEKKQINIVNITEDNYPSRLKNIYDPPYVLYYRGNLPSDDKKTISIVGARNCSQYGKEVATKFAYDLASEGYSIISGMAKGIDTYAHKGAIRANKDTYAILGCGVDICYPKENIEVFMEIINSGGLISEFDMGTLPRPTNFPMRNRIISGLSDGILVIEAKEKSGSLITVDVGLEQGKEIYVVPGNIDSELSKGCNNLIKCGARMVTQINDILDDDVAMTLVNKNNLCHGIPSLSKESKVVSDNKKEEQKCKIDNLAPNEKEVYKCVTDTPKHIEEIMIESKVEFGEVMQILFELEGMELVIESTNNYYIKKLF